MNSKITYTLLSILFLISAPCVTVAEDQSEALKKELTEINYKIEEAKKEDAKLSGGLIKALIHERIELLETNAALVQQRMHAIQSGAKVIMKVNMSEPNLKRAAEIQTEIQLLNQKISEQQTKSDQYRGGLIKAQIESTIATMHTTLAMLETEYLKAKYGIHWPPSPKDSESQATKNANAVAEKSTVSPATKQAPDKSTNILKPTLSNKRIQEMDVRNRIYKSAIWFDITWDTANLPKATRAVKGILIMADLFGDEKNRIKWTINDSLTPNGSFSEAGVGFEYNQFRSSHEWVRQTNFSDMTFKYQVKSIIYQDGTSEEF